MSVCDILLHVEDPGAANIIAPLVPLLAGDGLRVRFVVEPELVEYLNARGHGHETRVDKPDALLDAARPEAVVVGTSENTKGVGLALTDAARQRGVPSLGAVDMLVNADRRFRGGGDDPLAHAPDWLAVPDPTTKGRFAAIGFPAGRIVCCGHPHFDVVRARRAAFEACSRAQMRRELLPSVAEDRPILVFLAEGIDRLNPAASKIEPDSVLRGSGATDDRTTVVLEEVLAAVAPLDPPPYVVLRLHPKNGRDDYAEQEAKVDLVSYSDDPLPLLWCADLLVGMTTFLLVEAYLLGRPTLSVLPCIDEAIWLPTTAAGVTPVVSTPAALAERLRTAWTCDVKPDSDDFLPSGSTQHYLQLIRSLLTKSPTLSS